MISTDQRRAAYGLVIVLCAAWLALGVALVVTAYTVPVGMDGGGGFLFVYAVAGVGITVAAAAALVTGLRFVRRVDAGVWPWRTVVMAAGIGCVTSALAGWWVSGYLPVVALLLALQVVLLASLAALLHPMQVD